MLVHTKGVDDEIESVYNDILKEFACIREGHPFVVSEHSEEKIIDWLDDNDPEEQQFGFINNKYSLTDLLRFIGDVEESWAFQTRSTRHILHHYHDDITRFADESGIEADELIKWLIGKEIGRIKDELSAQDKADLAWDRGDGFNFICTGRVFISVIQKKAEDPEQELMNKLCESLYQMNASPMQLLMAKMRHELDEKGIEQASGIVTNQYAQAGWLYNLLQYSSSDPFEHDKAIDLHWEQISRSTKNDLRQFSMKLVKALKPEDNDSSRKAVEKFFKNSFGDEDLIWGHLNAYRCSMPVSSSNLTTGTILDIDGEYWVCLSPACDLVPGQKSSWSDRIGKENLAFKAVLLSSEELKTANKGAHKGKHIFLEEGDKVIALSFAAGENPKWDTFYARSKGKLSEDKTLELIYLRRQYQSDTNLCLQQTKAKVVAELRYEYALNLLQRLGNSQTRVGLDFKSKEVFS